MASPPRSPSAWHPSANSSPLSSHSPLTPTLNKLSSAVPKVRQKASEGLFLLLATSPHLAGDPELIQTAAEAASDPTSDDHTVANIYLFFKDLSDDLSPTHVANSRPALRALLEGLAVPSLAAEASEALVSASPSLRGDTQLVSAVCDALKSNPSREAAEVLDSIVEDIATTVQSHDLLPHLLPLIPTSSLFPLKSLTCVPMLPPLPSHLTSPTLIKSLLSHLSPPQILSWPKNSPQRYALTALTRLVRDAHLTPGFMVVLKGTGALDALKVFAAQDLEYELVLWECEGETQGSKGKKVLEEMSCDVGNGAISADVKEEIGDILGGVDVLGGEGAIADMESNPTITDEGANTNAESTPSLTVAVEKDDNYTDVSEITEPTKPSGDAHNEARKQQQCTVT